MYTKYSQTLRVGIRPGVIEGRVVVPEADRKVMRFGIIIVTNRTIPVAQELAEMNVEHNLRGRMVPSIENV